LTKLGFFAVLIQIASSQLMKRLQRLFCNKLRGIETFFPLFLWLKFLMAASFVTEWHDISLNCNSAALFHNASTKFSDGTCFGIGGEVLPVGCVL